MLWCKVTHTPIFAHFWCKNYFQVALASGGRQEFELHWHSWHSLCTDLHISLAWVHMAQSPNLTHTHTSELILQANALTFDSLNLPITWVNQSWAFFFFAHLHTHINTTSVGTRIRTAGMCWKVWMLLVIGRSHKMTYLAVIWETARGRKRRREGGKKRNEGDLTVCVCERERLSAGDFQPLSGWIWKQEGGFQ